MKVDIEEEEVFRRGRSMPVAAAVRVWLHANAVGQQKLRAFTHM